jgi:hypothetical protein
MLWMQLDPACLLAIPASCAKLPGTPTIETALFAYLFLV